MPVYHFKTRYGNEIVESDGMPLESTRQPWKQATRAAGENLKDLDGSLEPHREWRMDVSDDDGNALFSLRPHSGNVCPPKRIEKALLKSPSLARFNVINFVQSDGAGTAPYRC
jgi:hypothetical protein